MAGDTDNTQLSGFLVTLGAFGSFLPERYDYNKIFTVDKKTTSKSNKKAVLVYSVKNEYAIANKVLISVFNNQESLSEVVIISNSDEDTAIQLEKNILQKITSNYGVKSSFFAGRPPKHIALYSWCHSMPDIEYFVTSDADSYYPSNVVQKLLEKAEHYGNQEVAIFQSAIHTFKADTLFNRFLGIGQKLSGRLYAVGFTKIMGQSGYYGSGALIRMKDFLRAIDVIENNKFVPVANILSHDVWEAATLVNQGKNIQYLPEIVSFEEFPHTYIDMIKQSGRWLKGTFQSRKMLRIFGYKNHLAAIFLIVFPITMYLTQPIFLFWLILGFLRIFFSQTINTNVHLIVTGGIISLVFAQKFLAVRKLKEVFEVVIESLFSTIFYINTPIFNTWGFIQMWQKMSWVPMPKVFKAYTLTQCLKVFQFNMIFGVFILMFVYFYKFDEVLWAIPIFGSLSISGVAVYLAQYIPKSK